MGRGDVPLSLFPLFIYNGSMKNNTPYQVFAYYFFTAVENPEKSAAEHKKFLRSLDAKGRIYLSYDGINGQLSIHENDAPTYISWLKELYPEMQIKIHYWHDHAFEKLTLKVREQLCALDEKVDISKTGEHVSPETWRQMLESEDRPLLLDVRNDYEWEVGHFQGAENPACNTFREFRDYAENLKKRIDPENTPVMMCCTGGIRCEVYSAYLKEKGFKTVYQLDGGIINYGLKEGGKHWNGKLYVFDDRMTVPISEEETPVVGKCHQCEAPTEDYYNCANMDCNKLILTCKPCILSMGGCCSKKCEDAPRVRPVNHQNPHKPFRKRHKYALNTVIKPQA